MRKLIFILLSLFLFASTDFALSANEAELKLWKRDPFWYGACGHCGNFEQFIGNRDSWDFSEFDLYRASGYYTLDLTGPADTTVTLFARKSFQTDSGFFILIKKDDAQITILDLENFPPESWVERKGDKNGGGVFSAYYHPYQNFKSNIASVKWGKWWSALPLPPGTKK